MISIKAACPERPGMAPGRTGRIFTSRAANPRNSRRVYHGRGPRARAVKTGQAGGKPISMLEGESGTLRRRRISGRPLGNILGNRHQGGVVRALTVWQAGVKGGDVCGPNPGRSVRHPKHE
jgi:hypothetical protein